VLVLFLPLCIHSRVAFILGFIYLAVLNAHVSTAALSPIYIDAILVSALSFAGKQKIHLNFRIYIYEGV